MRARKAWTTLGKGCQAFSLKRADEVMMYNGNCIAYLCGTQLCRQLPEGPVPSAILRTS